MGPRQGREESAGPWNFVRDGDRSFRHPNHLVGENYFIESKGEQRYQVIGMTRRLALLLVVFVDRRQRGIEVIQLISARKAVDYEKSIYNDQFR